MCRFLSGIGFKDGSIRTSDYTDDHQAMIEAWELHETSTPRDNGWVRLEYTSNNLTDISVYKLSIDETDAPDWVTTEIRDSWIKKLNTRLKKMILSECNINCLLGGRLVFGKNVVIKRLVNCTVVNAGHSTIEDAGCSTIKDAGYSTIKDAVYSTIENAGYSTIKDAGCSTILNAGHSTILNAGHSTIKDAGHSTILNAWCSTIKDARRSTIENAGCSTILNAEHSTILNAGYSTILNKTFANL